MTSRVTAGPSPFAVILAQRARSSRRGGIQPLRPDHGERALEDIREGRCGRPTPLDAQSTRGAHTSLDGPQAPLGHALREIRFCCFRRRSFASFSSHHARSSGAEVPPQGSLRSWFYDLRARVLSAATPVGSKHRLAHMQEARCKTFRTDALGSDAGSL
jgi:hypothetical protein